jgi:mRNA interferase RelE/StbE
MEKTRQPQWKVDLSRRAERVLARLPRNLLERVDAEIHALAVDPFPPGHKKLSGTRHDNLYRVRVGDWRISYAVEKDKSLILILEVAPRGDAYRF